jgi:hypothetical protein
MIKISSLFTLNTWIVVLLGIKNKSWNDKLRVKSIESNILLEYKYDLLKKI